jgi:phage terminase small subunit
MNGRRPKPTHLRLLDGNAGHRPINEAEPVPEGDLNAAPEWMSEAQQKAWAYAIDNAPPGLLKDLDQSVLVVWVVAEDLHRQATIAVGKFGMITKSSGKGEPIQNPYLPIINRQAQIMLKAKPGNRFANNGRRSA